MSEENKAHELITTGTELAGASIGGALGFLAGGPFLAGAASALGVVIAKTSEKLLLDITNRDLSKREEIRVGATAAYSLDKVQKYLIEGRQPRDDGFFGEEKNNRSNGEEVFEGVLLKAKNEHEEKKMKILANIFANISFLPGFTIGEANHLLQIASNLTYRQMCTLALVGDEKSFNRSILRETDYEEFEKEYKDCDRKLYFEIVSILQEIYDMYISGIIACKAGTGDFDYFALFGWTQVIPSKLELTQLGKHYYNVLGLSDVPQEDINSIGLFLT